MQEMYTVRIEMGYRNLLHTMYGYQCDKAVNKNDTCEVI